MVTSNYEVRHVAAVYLGVILYGEGVGGTLNPTYI